MHPVLILDIELSYTNLNTLQMLNFRTVNLVNVENNYFRVSAIDTSNSTCARMEYYTALLDNGKIEIRTYVEPRRGKCMAFRRLFSMK